MSLDGLGSNSNSDSDSDINSGTIRRTGDGTGACSGVDAREDDDDRSVYDDEHENASEERTVEGLGYMLSQRVWEFAFAWVVVVVVI